MAIIGIDEAGRGPLAGPVVAAAVVLDEENVIIGLNDSKKLSEKKRVALYEEIHRRALFVSVAEIDAKMIDQVNILQATLLAMKQVMCTALIKFPEAQVLIDGNQIVAGMPLVKQTAIIKGDSLVEAIMAASIIAKVYRDRLMGEWDLKYPAYGFAKHKGYGTKLHIEAISNFGACEIHRKSFAPLKGATHEQGHWADF